jgi:hypothetical protein
MSAATITVAEDSGTYTGAGLAADITPGIGDMDQTVSFSCTNDNNALFSVQPAISDIGTLTFTPAANAFGTAIVSVVATDSTGLSSSAKTFNIEVTSVLDAPVLAAPATITTITTTSATLGGEVLGSDGTITERGILISRTASNTAPSLGGAEVTKLTASGAIGIFTVASTGLTPNTNYSIRAYAISSAGTGYSNVATFATQPEVSYTHQELWRFANFGSYDPVASAADSADPDGDGLNNLLEYALGTAPNTSGVMPAVLALNGANLEYTYTRSTAAKDNGVTYQIEWSDTLEADSWSTQTVTQQITSEKGRETVKASVPKGNGGKRFLRLRVSAPVGDQ